MLGEIIDVIVDRPLGSAHPVYHDCIYPVNYGYAPGVFAGDGEEQDVYILGINECVTHFKGRLIAIIRRINDHEDKWVAAPDGMLFSADEIRRRTEFIEKYFESDLILWHTEENP